MARHALPRDMDMRVALDIIMMLFSQNATAPGGLGGLELCCYRLRTCSVRREHDFWTMHVPSFALEVFTARALA